MGISRTPVREAVLQLSNEGLFTIHRNIGVSVRKISSDEIEDLFQLREAIESFCCKFAAESENNDVFISLITNITTITDNLEELIAKNCTPAEFMEHDTGFHLAIVNYTANKKFIEIMEQIRFRINLVGVKATIPGRLNNFITEHRQKIKNIANNDTLGVSNAITYHFKQVKGIYLEKNK
jgi:DNA-binding GntR family transcriptional regulator